MLKSRNLDGLVDLIYEAAVFPELWLEVLDQLAALTDTQGGTLFTASRDNQIRSITSEPLAHMASVFANDGWSARNTRASRLASKRYPGFATDDDLFTSDEMDEDPFYVELLRPNQLGWGAGTIIPVPTGDTLAITVEGSRPVQREAVAVLDALRPHLARSALLSARLGLEQARSTVDALQKIGLPAAVLSHSHHLLAANLLLEQFGRQIRFLARDRIEFRNARANALFEDAFAQLERGAESTSVWSIPIPAEDDLHPTIIHLLPVRRSARDLFTGAAGILVVTPVMISGSSSYVDLLDGLFDLTPAESRLAALIASGLGPRDAAAKLGISEATARSALKIVFSKVGVTRQNELAALLSTLVLR